MFRTLCKSPVRLASFNHIRQIRSGSRKKTFLQMQQIEKLASFQIPLSGQSNVEKCKILYCRIINSNEYDIVKEYSIKAWKVSYPVAINAFNILCKHALIYSVKLYEKLYPVVMHMCCQYCGLAGLYTKIVVNMLYDLFMQIRSKLICISSATMDNVRMKIKEAKRRK